MMFGKVRSSDVNCWIIVSLSKALMAAVISDNSGGFEML